MKIKDATAGIESQLRIQTRLILLISTLTVLIGILITVSWLPPIIALSSYG